ncbi:mycothiol conjugate amidase Mca [Naumannella halotolerans]|uniref:Mycothiol S-conjugate amidase n=1 Tax=Naumannella halotolerans TaxID=993414 RepID=A0A4V3EN60_9ACTN|nr:mycothiol conjugate amidase Mca [Naumannella halotolerans]TDT32568.1 mycothiol S-conjugate amidase [Naumannella halotolerans]
MVESVADDLEGPAVVLPRRHDHHGEPLRLLHVHAHPDDESSKGAATTARYVAEGVEVMVATCTGGERGSILNPAMERPDIEANIAEVRRNEMAAARKILGIEQVWLGFVDSGLPEGDPLPPLPEGCFGLTDPQETARELVKVIRQFRPQVMTTYDENGGYPHPDHIMTHRISMTAYELAADPAAWPELGEPWEVSKLYYHMTFHRRRLAALDAAMTEEGLESPYREWLANWDRGEDWEKRVTTRVWAADWFGVRDAALLAHATQVDPDGRWFAIPLHVQRRAWPTEDFELARSRVESSLPEDDLFAGIAVESPVVPAVEEASA